MVGVLPGGWIDLMSRSGDAVQFKNRVDRCNKANVPLYADAAFNHMAYFGK